MERQQGSYVEGGDPSGRVEFPWDTLDSIIGGKSPIDVPWLSLSTLEEAEAFLDCYGFAWGDPRQRRQIEGIRAEAIAFIEGELLADEPALRIPALVRAQSDVRRLLLWASRDPEGARQRWACALLRVMHTVAHGRSSLNERFGRQIRRQILTRFTPHVHRTSHGLMLGLGSGAVPLADFEVRASKGLRSVVTKLLHKVENVAADVFDRIGVRFITRERFDTLLVVRYLRANNVIMFANVIPARSRNTLIDVEWVRGEVERLHAEVLDGKITEGEAMEVLRQEAREQPYPEQPAREVNPFSSIDYRSIQFTCRQQIRIADPQLRVLGISERAQERAAEAEQASRRELRFFVPYEVQILDRESFEVSRSGLASHEVYKSRQREAVKRRVLGPLLAQ
jgi:uncharacterized protein (TIGR04562 family)